MLITLGLIFTLLRPSALIEGWPDPTGTVAVVWRLIPWALGIMLILLAGLFRQLVRAPIRMDDHGIEGLAPKQRKLLFADITVVELRDFGEERGWTMRFEDGDGKNHYINRDALEDPDGFLRDLERYVDLVRL